MQINPFKLERYFAEYEFKVRYLLSSSDCESIPMKDLIAMADAKMRSAWDALTLGYTESAGHPLLRSEVARLYENIGADGILIAVPEEAILIAMHALLSAGDHVIVTHPSYQSLYEIARSIGCEITPWSLKPENGEWLLDLQFLADHITPRTRLLVINFPHNPTGYLPSRKDYDAIFDIARQHNLYVFSDEMYRLLEYSSTHRLPSACDIYERAITVSGLSKNLGLPGLRVGWLGTQNLSIMPGFMKIKDYTTICSCAPGEILAIIALRTKEALIARNLEIVRANLSEADNFFDRFSHLFDWLRPQAGSVAFPELISEMPVDQFCRDLLEREGVMVVAGSLFEFPGNHFRLGLGRRSFPDALNHVEAYVQSL
jgi:aspartate/methionine/tyrosine aminotransferase